MLSSKLLVTLGQKHRAVVRDLCPGDFSHFSAGRAQASVSLSEKSQSGTASWGCGGRDEVCARLSTGRDTGERHGGAATSVRCPVSQLSAHTQEAATWKRARGDWLWVPAGRLD